jgi:hypothetical protein
MPTTKTSNVNSAALLDFGRLPENATNELLLGSCVPLAILGKLLLQGVLEHCIPYAERLVSSEPIPELQVIAPLRVVYGH